MGCDIITRGGGGDNPRNVMASPLTGVQAGEAFDVLPWAEAASDYLLSICRDIHMPRKLKVAFCNGVDDCVHASFRDMGFVAQPDGSFRLYIAGGLGNNHRMGVLAVEEHLPASDVLYAIRGMIDAFCAHGNYENRAKVPHPLPAGDAGRRGAAAVCVTWRLWRPARPSRRSGPGPDPQAAVTKTGAGSLEHDARVPSPRSRPGCTPWCTIPSAACCPPASRPNWRRCCGDMPAAECRVAPQ